MNPIKLWRSLFLPKTHQWGSNESRQADILLLFTFIAFLVGAYSLIKWTKNGEETLVFTSIFLIVLELISATFLKISKRPVLALNRDWLPSPKISLKGLILRRLSCGLSRLLRSPRATCLFDELKTVPVQTE